MIENKNGFLHVEGRRVFSVDPEDFIERLRYNWLGAIQEGHTVVIDTIVPYLEMEAVSRLGKEWTVESGNRPKMADGYEYWRCWWVNEASHNCDVHSPVGCAGYHLTKVGQAAVNILMAASALRSAMDNGTKEETAALSMLLLCEAIVGGYGLERDATKEAHETMIAKSETTYKKSIGAESEDQEKARQACISAAEKMWAADPMMRIGAVSIELNKRLLSKFEKLETLDQVPQADTIRGWLKDAAKAGKLTIPAAAQRRGREPKAPI